MKAWAAALWGLGRWSLRALVAIVLATAAVRVAIEISIDGGLASVVLFPGTPLDAPQAAPIVEEFDLDRSLPVRHGLWMADALQGDFRRTTRGGDEVTTMLAPRLPITFQLTIAGLAIAFGVGIPLGVLAARLTSRREGAPLSALIGVSQATPVFVLSIGLSWLLALRLGWVPPFGWVRPSVSITGNLRNLALPALAIGIPEAAVIARLVKSNLQSVMGEEYIVAAQAKGLSPGHILVHHALRPSFATVLTQMGLIIGSLLGGTIIVERLFALGGLGVSMLEASISRDLHLLLAITTYWVTLIVVIRGLSDVVHRHLDPRLDADGTN